MKLIGYFVDVDGRIHTIADWYEHGCSALYKVKVIGDSVYEVVEEAKDGGVLLGNQYDLHKTLTSLANAIEGDSNEMY